MPILTQVDHSNRNTLTMVNDHNYLVGNLKHAVHLNQNEILTIADSAAYKT